MTWQKTINFNEVADITNQNLELRLYFSDDFATPPNQLRAQLIIKVSGDTRTELIIDKALTEVIPSASNRTTFTNLAAGLRDMALTLEGYVDI